MQNKLEKEKKCSNSMRTTDFCTFFFFFLSIKTKKNLAQFHTKCMGFCSAICSMMMKGYLEKKLQWFYYLFIFNLLIKTAFLKDAIS